MQGLQEPPIHAVPMQNASRMCGDAAQAAITSYSSRMRCKRRQRRYRQARYRQRGYRQPGQWQNAKDYAVALLCWGCEDAAQAAITSYSLRMRCRGRQKQQRKEGADRSKWQKEKVDAGLLCLGGGGKRGDAAQAAITSYSTYSESRMRCRQQQRRTGSTN